MALVSLLGKSENQIMLLKVDWLNRSLIYQGAAYVLLQFTRTFRKDFTDMQRAMMNKEDPDQLVFLKRKKKCVINLFKY